MIYLMNEDEQKREEDLTRFIFCPEELTITDTKLKITYPLYINGDDDHLMAVVDTEGEEYKEGNFYNLRGVVDA